MPHRSFSSWAFRGWAFRNSGFAGPRVNPFPPGFPVLGRGFERGLLGQIVLLLKRLVVHLFVNNVSPTPDDNGSEYEELVAPYYASVPLLHWSTPIVNPQGQTVTYADIVSFTATVGPTRQIYGYYVTDRRGRFCWGERDPDAPFFLAVGGPAYALQLRFVLRDGAECP